MYNRQLHTLHSPGPVAPASDDTMVLADNLRLDPDILIGNGNGILGYDNDSYKFGPFDIPWPR